MEERGRHTPARMAIHSSWQSTQPSAAGQACSGDPGCAPCPTHLPKRWASSRTGVNRFTVRMLSRNLGSIGSFISTCATCSASHRTRQMRSLMSCHVMPPIARRLPHAAHRTVHAARRASRGHHHGTLPSWPGQHGAQASRTLRYRALCSAWHELGGCKGRDAGQHQGDLAVGT